MKGKALIVIGVVSIAIGIVGYLYYRYISSAEYSLMQIKDAYDQHDITEFEKYVDIKTLVGSILDKTLNQVSERSTATTKAERLGEDLGKGLINLMRPQLEELWVQQVRKLVETGSIGSGDDKKGLDNFWAKSDTATFKGVKGIKQDGKVATISLEFNQPRFDTTLVIDVVMRDKGNYWQLFDISNIFEYTETIEALEENRVNRLNEQVKEEFFKHVSITGVHLRSIHQGYFSWYDHIYTVDFENIGTEEISEITCFFDIFNSSGQRLKSGHLLKQVNLLPAQKYSYKETDFYSTKKIDATGLTIDVTLVGLRFKDRADLVWHAKWSDLAERNSSHQNDTH